MAILSYASAVASQGASYAFSTATSYVLRSDTTSSSSSEGKENIKPLSSGSSHPSTSSTFTSPSAKRLSRQSSSKARLPSYNASSSSSKFGNPSPSSTTAPQSSTSSSSSTANARGEAEDLVDSINATDELYLILGVTRKAKSEEIRRGFLGRSRICHPDKLPHYPPSTTAFQRLSYAYETLSKPASRRIYDLGGMRSFETGGPGTTPTDPATADETLNGVLRSVINEFLHGDFEMIRVFVTALNEGSPGLNLGEDAIDNLEGAFRRAREVLLGSELLASPLVTLTCPDEAWDRRTAGQKYALLLKFSLIRMYEIQISLRRLSYFDLYGRLRLTMELLRSMVEVPLILDKAMREDISTSSSPQASYSTTSEGETGGVGKGGQLESRGILGVRTKGMLVLTCRMLEKAERWTGGSSSPRGNWEDGEDATANAASTSTSAQEEESDRNSSSASPP